MIDWNTLIIGLVFLCIGLTGLVIKRNVREDQKKSLTGANITWGTYAVLSSGIFLIIWSIFSN